MSTDLGKSVWYSISNGGGRTNVDATTVVCNWKVLESANKIILTKMLVNNIILCDCIIAV